MSNFFVGLAVFCITVIGSLFAIPYFVDWNSYRGVFEEEATRILGREVRVGGNVNVRLLPSPYVSFEKLRIADPTGSTGEPFFRAENFTMRLSAPPLLKGIIEGAEKTRFDRAHFASYGDFNLVIEVVYYVLSSDYNVYMDIQQAINFAIKEEFEKRGIAFAFPTQTLFVRPEGEAPGNGSGDAPATQAARA